MNSPISSRHADAFETPAGSDFAIKMESVSVRYWLKHHRRATFQSFIADGLLRRAPRRSFWALQDVSLTLGRGQALGLIGPNGAGKSTLIRVMAGILLPVRGRVQVRGRVAALAELGAGFYPELSGRDNIFLKAALMGQSERDLRQRFERIVEFAGIREFIDQPLRTYSTGMLARLGFSVATDVQPEVLLVDEVLSVGDSEFQSRSRARMEDLRSRGTTIVLVSHSLESIETMCSRAAWLSYGRLQMVGETAAVLAAYRGAQAGETAADAQTGPGGTMRFMLDHPISGSGWYAVERDPQNGPFRWTGPGTRATLDLPVQETWRGRDLRLRVRLLLAISPRVGASLHLDVDTQPVPLQQNHLPDGSILIEGTIPQSSVNGQAALRLGLQVDQTESPGALRQSMDQRRLGVAVSWIELQPVRGDADDAG